MRIRTAKPWISLGNCTIQKGLSLFASRLFINEFLQPSQFDSSWCEAKRRKSDRSSLNPPSKADIHFKGRHVCVKIRITSFCKDIYSEREAFAPKGANALVKSMPFFFLRSGLVYRKATRQSQKKSCFFSPLVTHILRTSWSVMNRNDEGIVIAEV